MWVTRLLEETEAEDGVGVGAREEYVLSVFFLSLLLVRRVKWGAGVAKCGRGWGGGGTGVLAPYTLN